MAHTTASDSPLLCWIIPVYNGEQFITQAIESILRQPCQDFEILIIDDGSTDNTAALVRPYLGARIRLLQKENGGVSSARNLGIQEARSRYLAFLDADDVVCRNAYTSDIHHMLSSGAYDLISFPYYSADQDLNRGIRHCTDETQHSDPFKHCASFLYLRSLICGTQALCFPEGIRIREDVVFQFLVNHRAKRVKIVDRPWFLYRNHVSSVLHRTKGYEYLVQDVIPAWQWCKDRCDLPQEKLECEQRVFSEAVAYIRLSCMSGKPLSHIQKVLELPAVQEALTHYDKMWPASQQEYVSFRTDPRKYRLRRRIFGIARQAARYFVRIPALRGIYLRLRYREKLTFLR